MSVAFPIPASPPKRRFPLKQPLASDGLIGIDIGTYAIKIAQLSRRGTAMRASARWVLPLDEACRPTTPRRLAATMEFFRSEWPELKTMFRGHRAAVTLPISCTPLRVLEIPDGTRGEVESMVQSELSDEPALSELFAFDCWEAKPPAGGTTNLTAIAVPHEASRTVANALLCCGLECQRLDALPCTLARSTDAAERALADTPTPPRSLAAIDLGMSTAQLVLCHQGQPGFCRTLPDCGLATLYETLGPRLQLTADECDLLLTGVGAVGTGVPPLVASTIGSLMTPTIETLLYEAQRTLNYVSHQYSARYPTRIWLFGAGARVCNLASVLSERLEMDVRSWSGDSGISERDAALFGPAYALSASCWEAT